MHNALLQNVATQSLRWNYDKSMSYVTPCTLYRHAPYTQNQLSMFFITITPPHQLCVLDVLDATNSFTVITQGVCLPDVCNGAAIQEFIRQV